MSAYNVMPMVSVSHQNMIRIIDNTFVKSSCSLHPDLRPKPAPFDGYVEMPSEDHPYFAQVDVCSGGCVELPHASPGGMAVLFQS